VDVEWSHAALEDMAALDKDLARRIKQPVERLADTGAGTDKHHVHSLDP
jgi:hypothetical protein